MATKTAPAAPAEKRDINWLAEQVEAATGETVEAFKLRAILRGLVKAEEIEHEAQSAWTFSGVKDPAVRAVIAKVKASIKAESEGAAPKPAKRAPAAKKAAPAKKAPVRRTRKAAPVEEVELEDEFDGEDIDLD